MILTNDANAAALGEKKYGVAKDMDDFIMAFIELQGWGGLTYRFEATNFHEQERCRVRSRYIGGTIATGSFNEIENSCSQAGEKYAIKVRGTF